ncbi:hypothetical protein PLESTB_001039600 [Pleodorina starrii]|uniref:procollagen-lysine 5-dioxygenase n=1 Tax=Pleodorina starrii TaxID=330485 RepID=A0A9W6BQF2_9CHLO|nr:hypothetical protein PLESTB_001039600 [Pleodorina starrii]GLC63870.1 hypothetical protein PLESTF_000092400 [Pleodorina starrii]
MDLTQRIDLLPDNVRRQILQAVCGNNNSPSASASAPSTAGAGTESSNNVCKNGEPAAATGGPASRLCSGQRPPEVRLVAGACIIDEFISQDHVKGALECAREALAEGQQQAALGGALPLASAVRQVDTESRGDTMRWLHPGREAAAGRGALASLLARMEALRRSLESQGYPVGGRPTYQLACYPGGGARYVRHADASVSCPTRTLTAICYINEPDWEPQADGGCLALYNVPYSGPLRGRGLAAGEPATVVAPLGGRLVVFESHLFHEVMPAYRSRYAVTAWFHSAPPPPTGNQAAAAAAAAAKHGAPQLPPPLPPPASAPAPPLCSSRQGKDTAAAAQPSPAATRASGQETQNGLAAPAPAAPAAPAPVEAGAAGHSAGADGQAAADAVNAGHSGGCGVGGGGGGDAAGRIFVCVAAYRDPEGPWTLHSLFSRAHHPERVRVGVVWQIDPATEAAFAGLAGSRAHPEWLKQVKQVILPYGDAEGPCKARALAQALWSGEEYVLQIDSHMRMVSGWDTLCVRQLAAAEAASPTGKAVLSTYPLGYSGSGAAASVPDEATAPATLLCAKGFEQDGFLRTVGRTLRERPSAPVPSHFWAAGLSFARSLWLQEVPYCPYLPHLFFGEESYMLARMWTRGWDVFAPAGPLAFHQWERSVRDHTYQRDMAATKEAAVAVATAPSAAEAPGAAVATAQVQAQSAEDTTTTGQEQGQEQGPGRDVRGGEPQAGEGQADAGSGGGGSAATAAAAVARRLSQARVLEMLSGGSAAAKGEGDGQVVSHGCGGWGGGGGGWAAGEVWGLGTVRSLAQLAAAGCVDYGARTVAAGARWGGLPEDAFEA